MFPPFRFGAGPGATIPIPYTYDIHVHFEVQICQYLSKPLDNSIKCVLH